MRTLTEQIERTKAALNEAEEAMDRLKKIDPCEDCEMKYLSGCCTAPVIMHDICSQCGEHCDSACDDCDWRV